MLVSLECPLKQGCQLFKKPRSEIWWGQMLRTKHAFLPHNNNKMDSWWNLLLANFCVHDTQMQGFYSCVITHNMPPPPFPTHTLAHKLERVLCIPPIHDWPRPRTVRNSGLPSFTAPRARTKRAMSWPRTQAGEHLFCMLLCVFSGENPGEHGKNMQSHVTNSRNIAKRVRNHILGI